MKEYKVILVKEGGISTILFGTGKLPLTKIEESLNTSAKDRWEMQFMIIEKRRMFLLLEREVAVITLVRDIVSNTPASSIDNSN